MFTVKVKSRGPGLEAIRRQMPFALANTLNRTAEEAQDRARLNIHAKLQIRSAQTGRFFERMIKIERRDRATKHNLRVVALRLDGPASGGVRDRKRAVSILLRHELGATRTRSMTAPFYLPAPGMRGPVRQIPRSLYPASLRLAERRDPSGASLPALRKGKRRTYVVPNVGIFQRSGRGKNSETDALWFFKARVTIRPRLGLVRTIQRTAHERFAVNLRGMLDVALRTAR